VHPANIFVIEDNPSDIFLLKRALQAQGEDFVLEAISDGKEALHFLHEQIAKGPADRPCVILLDLHLPKFDGLDVLRAIFREPALSHIPVMVVSSLATPDEQRELRSLGVSYRLKPNSLGEFTELANDLLAICKGLAAPA
jgi:CheY-like chemotaxis protein